MDPARVFDDLMALPPELRREVAERALATVDGAVSTEVQEAQHREAERRRQRLESGQTQPVPWEAARARLLAGRR